MKPSVSYKTYLLEDLKDPETAARFLNAVLETGHREAFLSSLRDVVAAHGGISKMARKTKLHRQTLHRILSSSGNPEIESLERILSVIGLRLFVGIDSSSVRRAA